jgi:hypothetical protein
LISSAVSSRRPRRSLRVQRVVMSSGGAPVSSATGRIRRGERAGERVPAIANFA